MLPVSIGPPLGINLLDFPGRIPLPAKIKIQVLPPIDLRERYGADPDPDEAYEAITAEMQDALSCAGRGADAARRRLIAGIPMWTASPSTNSASTGWKAATPGRVVARADQLDLDRHQHQQAEAHADRARGPRADRSRAMNSRIAALWIIQPKLLCASKLSAPKTPTPARKTCTTIADGDQQGEPVVGES